MCVTESEPQKRKAIVHRKPLQATIRQLYGTAFRCGKPGCSRRQHRLRRCLLSADPGQTSTILHPELRQSVRPRNSTARADTAAKRGLIGQDASSTRSGGVSSRWPGRRRWRGSRGGGVRSESFARSGTPASRTGCIRSRWFQERARTGRRPAGAAHPAATTAMSTKVTGLWNPQGRRSCAVDALGY